MRTATLLILASALLMPAGGSVAAGLKAGKICQVIRTCNFARTASVRGCLSSYSCRQCDFVKRSVVSVNGVRRVEWRTVCGWGAGS